MASPLPSGSSVEVATEPGAVLDSGTCGELTALPGLIESITVDAATGKDGVDRAMRNLFTCLCKSCENDNLALFQTILSCMNSTEMCPAIETELLRSSILNASFRCARYLVQQIQTVNLCSVVSWMCVRDWDEITFETLVNRGFKLTDCACKGMGALKHCIINGNEKLVKVCLQNGCSPNAQEIELPPDDDHTPEVAVDEFSPLMCAILYANAGIVGELLCHGVDLMTSEKCGMSPLEAAVYASKPKETALLVEAFKNISRDSPENRDIFEADVNKAFMNAVSLTHSNNVKDCLRILVRAGADVNKTDVHECLPLLMAIDAKQLHTVSFLLQNGCDVNCTGNVPVVGNDYGYRQMSPLELAASQSDEAILELLLKSGATVKPGAPDTEESRKRITLCRKRFTLSDWCRVSVRRNVKYSPLRSVVEDFEVPGTLKHFLTMSG
ncbi:serine/threonine-protein phosphatase 6 regulatory ankyrin repeat subunit C-like [Liolophura sinensis]|uniref:serine/threonine-protein phosphatase 6 regulatory ankyrin repeat subunit C-like n=1 Tax=Liolophura sinensis TaxID=3198878 RepID=UPI003158CDF1